MKLFETSWAVKGKVYIREYDTTLEKSVKKLTEYQSEYYLEDNLGEYKSLLNPDINLRRVQGSSYNISNAYGAKDGKYVAIRDEYILNKNQYNKNPRIWYFDIETSVSRSFKNINEPNKQIKIRIKD